MSKSILERLEEAYTDDSERIEELILKRWREHLKKYPVMKQQGGKGSGNWKHKGRKGKRGGSEDRDMPGEGGITSRGTGKGGTLKHLSREERVQYVEDIVKRLGLDPQRAYYSDEDTMQDDGAFIAGQYDPMTGNLYIYGRTFDVHSEKMVRRIITHEATHAHLNKTAHAVLFDAWNKQGKDRFVEEAFEISGYAAKWAEGAMWAANDGHFPQEDLAMLVGIESLPEYASAYSLSPKQARQMFPLHHYAITQTISEDFLERVAKIHNVSTTPTAHTIYIGQGWTIVDSPDDAVLIKKVDDAGGVTFVIPARVIQNFDESQVNRYPKGTERGGQFAPKRGVIRKAGGHDPRERFEEFKKKFGVHESITVDAFARDTWEHTDAATGMYSEVTLVTMHPKGDSFNRDVISIEGKIYMPDGTDVGEFQRSLNIRTGEVHNHVFELQKDFRGMGFGGKFYVHSEDALRSYGVKKISLFANAEVGGYAWARMGFDFEHGWEAENATIGVKNKWAKKFPTTKFPYKKAKLTPWEIASLKGPSGELFGKEYLLDGQVMPVLNRKLSKSWSGVKSLDPADKGFQVGELYYQIKGYK